MVADQSSKGCQQAASSHDGITALNVAAPEGWAALSVMAAKRKLDVHRAMRRTAGACEPSTRQI